MGLFDAFRGVTGGVDRDLLSRGRPGRGIVLGVQVNGAEVSFGPDSYRVCDLTLQVFLDGVEPYVATCRQRVHEVVLPQLGGGMALAVRADPADTSRVAVAFGEEPPVVTLARPADGGAAAIVATGAPATAVVVASAPLGVRSHDGHDVHVFTLTVMPGTGDPYQVQVGNPLPLDALPLVFPGARLPVRIGPAGPHAVAVDWDRALGAGGVSPASG